MSVLTSEPYLIFYLSFWLLIEYQEIGKFLTMNPFQSVLSIMTFPSWLKNMTLLFSNMFLTILLFLSIVFLSILSDPWYYPIIGLFIAWSIGLGLLKIGILRMILGYRLIAVLGPLWIIGAIYFIIAVLQTK